MRRITRLSILVMAAAAVTGTGTRAQTPGASAAASSTAFEVASVKPSDPAATGMAALPIVRRVGGGRFIATSLPLRVLVRVAYGLEDFQISGGPPWQLSQKFEINAKMPDSAGTDMSAALPMLRTLLAERFKLKTHTETRDMPIYALVVARSDGKLGPGMTVSTSACEASGNGQQKLAEMIAKEGPAAIAARIRSGERIPCAVVPSAAPGVGMSLHGDGQPIATLTRLLTTATGRLVQDRTGLTERYDWTLTFDPDVLLRIASQVGVTVPLAAAAPPSDSPALLTAIQEQLGLKLDSRRGPVDILVIDSATMPDAD